MFKIRNEAAADIAAVRDLNLAAFGQTGEADIVDALRGACPDLVALVAEDAGQIVGHILFSPVEIAGPGGCWRGMGLAPMSVRPERQRQGVGSALVRHGLAMLRADACPFVIVLGHPTYYPRFGFTPAAAQGVICPWPGVPDEAFMLLVLAPQGVPGLAGIASYRPEFDTTI